MLFHYLQLSSSQALFRVWSKLSVSKDPRALKFYSFGIACIEVSAVIMISETLLW